MPAKVSQWWFAASLAFRAQPLCTAAVTRCPKGYCRNSSVVWNCQGSAETAYFFLDPDWTIPTVEIPTGVQNLWFNGRAGAVALLLADPGSGKIVAADNGGVVHNSHPTDVYAGMNLTCIGVIGGGLNKTCFIGGYTTTTLLIKFLKLHGAEKDLARLSYKYERIQPCPARWTGCTPYSEAKACEEVAQWSRWLRSKYPEGAGAAWTQVAHPYSAEPEVNVSGSNASAPPARSVPWFLWEGVWGQWRPTQRDGYQSFHYLDVDHDQRISQREFSQGYQLSGNVTCKAPEGSDVAEGSKASDGKFSRWWTSWVPMAALGLLIWSPLVVWMFCCLKSSRQKKDASHEPHEGDALMPEVDPHPRAAPEAQPAAEDHIVPVDTPHVEAPRNPAFDRLFTNPAAQLKVESHPASMFFHQARLLGYKHRLVDGFRAHFSQEMLLVDSRSDKALRGFLVFLRSSLPIVHGAVHGSEAHVTATAKAVAAAFGGARHEHEAGEELEARWQRRFHEVGLPFPHDLPIGLLLARTEPGSGLPEPGAGLPRHRAVMFKYVCDALDICESALLWDTRRDTAVNVAWTGGPDGRPMLVDCTTEPGQLRVEHELHHLVLDLESDNALREAAGITMVHRQ